MGTYYQIDTLILLFLGLKFQATTSYDDIILRNTTSLDTGIPAQIGTSIYCERESG
jgi:hypothetical protein